MLCTFCSHVPRDGNQLKIGFLVYFWAARNMLFLFCSKLKSSLFLKKSWLFPEKVEEFHENLVFSSVLCRKQLQTVPNPRHIGEMGRRIRFSWLEIHQMEIYWWKTGFLTQFDLMWDLDFWLFSHKTDIFPSKSWSKQHGISSKWC